MNFDDVLITSPGHGGVPAHPHDAQDIEGGELVLAKLKVDNLIAGSITGQEVIIAGGVDGVIRSDNYTAGTDGWAIFGDGSAEFSDVVVRGAIEAGVGSDVDWSFISNVSVENADIVSLTYDKITAGTNEASLEVGAAGTIGSANFVAGTSGWQIAGDGSAEFNNAVVRGDLIVGDDPYIQIIQDVVAITPTVDAEQYVRFGGTWNDGTISWDAYLAADVGDAVGGGFGSGLWLAGPADGTSLVDNTALLALTWLNSAPTAWLQARNVTITSIDAVSAIGATIRVKDDNGSGRDAIDVQAELVTLDSIDGVRVITPGNAGAPAFFYSVDTTTGPYWSASSFSIAVEATQVGQFGLNTFKVRDGTVSTPGIAFLSDPDNGMYLVSTGVVGLAAGGVSAAQFRSSGVLAADGAVGTPAYSFINDSNTGIYSTGANRVGISAQGAIVANFSLVSDIGIRLTDTAVNSTTAAAANMFINDTTGLLARSTSSLAFKPGWRFLTDLASVTLPDPITWTDEDDQVRIGLGAEHVYEALPEAYADHGQNYDTRAVLAVLVAKVNRLEAERAAA